MNPLEKATLGSSGLRVTRLGLGCASIGGLYGDIPDDQAVAVVHRALSLGLNLLDTAPLYGAGKSEIRLGQALVGVPRDSYVLASKVGRVLVPTEQDQQIGAFKDSAPYQPVFDFSYDGVMRSFEDSLKRLGVDRIDILHIHDPDNHYQEAIDGAYPALDKLRGEGVIRAVSAGMNQWEMLARFAREGDFDCFPPRRTLQLARPRCTRRTPAAVRGKKHRYHGRRHVQQRHLGQRRAPGRDL